MKKTGVFYGSTTGTTESVARMIANKLGISSGDVYDVSKLTADVAGSYEALILGTSTWGDGELQDDWYDGIKVLKGMDLSGNTFCDGMGILFNELKDSGCRFIGTVPATDYTYSSSVAVTDDGGFVGLAIDDINESDKTEERITAWTETLKAELA